MSARAARIELSHGDLVEWYENRREGLEQGFTIAARPPGSGRLFVRGAISRGLLSSSSADGQRIDVRQEHGACVLRYGELAARDARGVKLAAHLESAPGSITIRVEDRGALYPVTIDPLMSSPAWTADGGRLNAFYGYSVATAGDVNGDGFSDVLVGAINYDNGQYEEGRAFLYEGSADGLSPTPSWTAEGDQAIARFGQSVAAAGDVNGDGFGDVVIGAPQFDEGEEDEGRAFLYLGSDSGLAATPAWFAESDQADAYFGQAVASAGDVNADGFGDVVVGAYAYDHGQSNEGRVFVYLGSASGLALTPSWSAEGDQASAYFGGSVASAGDIDADGFGDVIVGAQQYDGEASDEGRACVYRGSPTGLLASPAWIAEGDAIGVQLGISVGTAGDVNGDGFADVVVGEQNYSNGESAEGRAFVFLGSPSGLGASPSWTAESNDPGAQFGRSVATAGDVNGDGFADVIVGAPLYGATTSRGRAFVYLGSAGGLANVSSWWSESDQDDAAYGQSVATAGDVNGDGFSDVLVGAPLHHDTQSFEGRAFVYLGSASGPSQAGSWRAAGDQMSAYFGYAVASAGDVNGDGFGDVIVGAVYYDHGEPNEGRAYLYLGSRLGLAATPAWTAESDQANSRFGQCVAGAGDVNGDGFDDVIVGAPQYVSGAVDDGRAFLYLGSASGLGAAPAWSAGCGQSHARFGGSVASAGDVNGDGYGDVVVGAFYYQNGQVEEGRAFLFQGSAAGLDPAPTWTAESDQALAFFGYSVSSAGDVNGDGFGDVIVGAYAYDNGQSNEGRAYVFTGSAAGLLSAPAWTAESDQADAYFGISVATAADVNGDGFSDVIVGAHAYDHDEANEGAAFVYLGSPAGLAASAAWTAESDQSSASFGISVSGAGDVNGDGYSDVVVGANAYDGGQADEGNARVFMGSAAGLTTVPAWAAESDQAFANFGNTVAAAGDVNGDGFGDVLVGAPYFDDGPIDAGRAVLFFGNGPGGIDRPIRQLEADASAPIAALGGAQSAGFRLEALGRSPAGRSQVRMEWQAEPLGTPFDGVPRKGGLLGTGAPVMGMGSMVMLGEIVAGIEPGVPYRWRLRVASSSPFFPHSPWVSPSRNGPDETDLRSGSVPIAVSRPPGPGTGLRLVAVRPNPSGARLDIVFSLPKPGGASLTIHDLQGRRVASLDGPATRSAGAHAVSWDGRDPLGQRVPPGVYWIRLESGGEMARTRFVRW